jgi:predicted PurR-regulated permease PerM
MNDLRTTNLLLGLLVAMAVGMLLLTLRGILLPLFVAMFLSYLVMPVVRWGKRIHVPAGLSIFLILLLLVLAFGTLGKVIYSSGAELLESLPAYEAQLRPYILRAFEFFKVPEELIPADDETIDWEALASSPMMMGYARAGVGNLLGWAGNLTLVLVFLVFIVLDRSREALDRRIVAAFSAAGTDNARPVLERIHRDIERYIITKTGISLFTGLLFTVILLLFDVRFALAFGAIAFLLNYIPNIGSFVATLGPIAIALVQYGPTGPWKVILLGVILVAVQMIIGNIAEPLIMGRTLQINPITVLLWLVFWGWLWGVWGMVLAVPIAATARIIFERTPALKRIGALMSDN